MDTSSPYRSGAERTEKVIVTTGNDVAGHKIVGYLGIVRGVIVRSVSFGAGFVGSIKQLAGGNIKEYVDVCEAARHDAYVEMLSHAEALGAHAIIGMRYDATEFGQGTTEVLAYGTAVRLQSV
ncbi:MAG: YbjQ family protein [Labilithrix sp.]|nr:YbjQ family protein [Labilithrix sp.]MCW5809528.1 YbjQ family protein [Labilithrix sp.]